MFINWIQDYNMKNLRWHSTANTTGRHQLVSDDDSAVVSALGYERLGPGFKTRRPESDFSSAIQKNEKKISSTPAAISTPAAEHIQISTRQQSYTQTALAPSPQRTTTTSSNLYFAFPRESERRKK